LTSSSVDTTTEQLPSASLTTLQNGAYKPTLKMLVSQWSTVTSSDGAAAESHSIWIHVGVGIAALVIVVIIVVLVNSLTVVVFIAFLQN